MDQNVKTSVLTVKKSLKTMKRELEKKKRTLLTQTLPLAITANT